ncbi:37 kDa salivary gland allergen Aed a 2-like [Anopheles cruzii]|uniref:37 kDa salivary gland allergen Aed a 2-like n=1 Tax=Anopheles cruzii TaxID=68878 RepID=UPI0022EC3E8A|nr:37 kDa salivary gland allergen Aed a 2-like [Anopheles cruzii]
MQLQLGVVVGFVAALLCPLVVLASPTRVCPADPSQEAAAVATGWLPRTPEQTLYAYVRCLNDSSASIEMKIRWVMWQPDTSPESQCYVKCVSENLRLYDRMRRQFAPERFEQQARAFHDEPEAPEMRQMYDDARRLLVGELTDNECGTVFAKYAPFYATHQEHILAIFHGDLRKILATYRRLGTHVKQIGQSFVDYCEKRYGFRWTEQVQFNCPNRTAVDCVLRGFRWITEEGAINDAEIVRDFKSAGQSVDELDKCTDPEQLYVCLRAHDSTALAIVIHERNAQTAYYFDQTSQEEPWKSAVQYGNSRLHEES